MKELFLTLLATQSAHGYELRDTLESSFGNLLPAMNAGQIYTTLARLERDGLIRGADVRDDPRGKRIYEITPGGRSALDAWINLPVPGTQLKHEFYVKFVLVVTARLAPPRVLIERQRQEYLQSLRDLDGVLDAQPDNPAIELLIEGAILHLKADLEWLDLMEQRHAGTE